MKIVDLVHVIWFNLLTLLKSLPQIFALQFHSLLDLSSKDNIRRTEVLNNILDNVNRWIDLIDLIIFSLMWMKIRASYFTNNWIYTTNHKRIAVNYFWFVILSGIVGMVLATLIRLEFAYPGVGIFAGDSLQYLSMATAHGVIMVFFMIMPLLFGAFANFLLPTQLGVHDVAFPRLNSAAFWFLPGGLLMLCQLVCVDRRYQRMNCFNIREIQALLKRKFFTDLINSHDHRNLLETTSIGLRFKVNLTNALNSNVLNFFNFGIHNTPHVRKTQFISTFINQQSYPTYTKNIFNLLNYNWNFFYNITAALPQFNSFYDFIKILFSAETFAWLYVFYKNTYFSMDNIYDILSYFFGEIVNIFSFSSHCVNNTYSAVISTTPFLNSNPFLNYFPLINFFEYIKFFLYINCSQLHLNNLINLKFSFLKYLNTVFDSYFDLFLSKKTLIIENLNNTFLYNSCLKLSIVFTECCSFDLFSPFFKNTAILFNLVTSAIFNTQLPFVFNTIYNLNLFNQSAVLLADNKTNLSFSSDLFMSSGSLHRFTYMFEETSDATRYLKFNNPLFKYDYKSGDYLPKLYKEIYTHLFTTLSNASGAASNASWFISDKYTELFDANFTPFFKNKILDKNNLNVFLNNRFLNKFSTTETFYNFFQILLSDKLEINQKWLSINALDQKFYRMFNTSSMQQRIYANWRQLKFTREAWRCKLLAARHQKTLFKRYLHEDGVFWSIERNAKDLLPGWAMITPFSARTRFTAIGKTDIGLLGVLLVINSSIISAANFLVTYRYLSTLNNRKMRDARSFFTEGVMVASWMMVTANPMLAIAIIMLLSDRHWQTSFFDYSGGGDTVLFQHMFWFFGHPEVYIIIIPTFGFANTMLSFYLKKRVSARASLLYSMYTIAFLGFFVWGHHMYMVGLAHTTRMLFSTLTVMISVPAATKIMHWCVTLANSAFATELPLLFTITFIFFFVSGGISGMCVAHTGMDILFHDTFYVIGHFHVMLAGAAMFSSFGAFYFYFPAIFGVKYSRIYAYLHYSYYLLGQLITVIPMFWLGYSGMPRRVLDYPASMGGWHSIISAGHMLSVAGLMAFFIMIFDSLRQGRAVTRNTFGISRYNTRVNFYLYEIARIISAQQRGAALYRYTQSSSVYLNKQSYQNFEVYETTLISYTFTKNS